MNYYEILKVSKNASQEQIKSSYKTLVKKYHPDLYVGDKSFAEKKIKEINEAYEILSNAEKKAEYDAYLKETSEVTHNYSATTSSTSVEKNVQNTTSTENATWSFSGFILEKFNKLEKKRQIQLFILILIAILALFLINLIQMKYYLSSDQRNTNNNLDFTEDIETYFSDDELNDFDSYNPNDFESIDDLFYDILEQYENEYKSSYDYY